MKLVLDPMVQDEKSKIDLARYENLLVDKGIVFETIPSLLSKLDQLKIESIDVLCKWNEIDGLISEECA